MPAELWRGHHEVTSDRSLEAQEVLQPPRVNLEECDPVLGFTGGGW